MGKKWTLDALGPELAPLGLILGPPGPILRALGQYFGLSMAFPGRFPPTFLAKLLHQLSRNVCGNFSVGLGHTFAGNCWELGTPAHDCNRWGPPWGAAVSAKRSTIRPRAPPRSGVFGSGQTSAVYPLRDPFGRDRKVSAAFASPAEATRLRSFFALFLLSF